MADSTLEDRLREHADAFDGLLSIIPAKHYYGKDNSDQWKKKKQTKQEAATAKRAKLGPDSEFAKSAKDVMDERAKKRKLEEVEEAGGSDVDGVKKEQPMQGLKRPQEKLTKKQKVSNGTNASQSSEKSALDASTKLSVSEKRSSKQERKRDRKKEKKQKDTSKKIGFSGEPVEDDTLNTESLNGHPETEEANEEHFNGSEMGHFDAEELEENGETPDSSTSANQSPQSPIFDQPTEPSANTSTSSIIPPAKAPKHIKIPTDPELLRSRLAARIEALRAARKADGPDGAPARNRQELMEARRKKEEQRRAHKKELRLQAKREEEARREAALASARDSPASGLMSPSIQSPPHQFSFGRVAFADGQQLADDLSSLQTHKKKGPRDAASALAANEKKCQRLAALDDEKRADIEEKDLWLNARKRAHGERVRDDSSLLKKTLKRKEKARKKSESEWKDRKDGVAKSQAMKQKKREENLKKRRDEKGVKGKKAKPGKKSKPKSRPGFEGSFGGKR